MSFTVIYSTPTEYFQPCNLTKLKRERQPDATVECDATACASDPNAVALDAVGAVVVP